MSVEYNGKKYNIKEDENGIISLNLSGQNITDINKIKGLKDLTNLQNLILSWNEIDELKGLDTLTKLEILHI